MATIKNPWEQAKTWDERMKLAAEQYATRPDFQYNLADDPLYNQYKEQYQRQGRLAMLDTMGQARANNGGYGTSYAMQVGQQAYNNQLAALNDRIPELYNIALSRYQNAGNDLLNRYNFAAQQAALEAAQNATAGGGGGGRRKVDLVTEATKVAGAMGVGAAMRYIQQQIGAEKSGEWCLDKKDKFVSGFSKTGKTNLFLAPPAISSVSKAENGNLISWKSVSGADGYRLYRKSYGSSWGRIVSTTDNSFVDTTAGKNTVIAYTLRCLDEKGNLISSYIDKTKYYRNGELVNGTVTVNGKKLNFDKGVLRTGMQTINGNKYYYNTSGVLQKNGIVGSDKDGWYYADKNGKIDFSYSNGITQNGKDWNVMSGKATKVKTKSDKTLFRALKVVAKVTNKSMSKSQKLKACFNYTKNAYKELNPRIPPLTDSLSETAISPSENVQQLLLELSVQPNAFSCARIKPPTALLQQTSKPNATMANIDECQRQSGKRSSRAPQCGFVICSMR